MVDYCTNRSTDERINPIRLRVRIHSDEVIRDCFVIAFGLCICLGLVCSLDTSFHSYYVAYFLEMLRGELCSIISLHLIRYLVG